MQKADLSNLGTLYLMNIETGEMTPWEGVTEITEEQSTIIKDLRDAIVDNLPDDKTPNPIYIPKHIQHRKRGRK